MKTPVNISQLLAKLAEKPLTERRRREAVNRLKLPLPPDGATEKDLLISRFKSMFLPAGPNCCWVWKGGFTSKGYAVIPLRIEGENRNLLASRFSYLVHTNQEPSALACHHCDNPRCVNPHHIFDGTHSDNMQDCAKKGRLNTTAPRNYCRGELVKVSKLKEAEVREILVLLSEGRHCAEIAVRFGVSKSNIGLIKTGKSWAHLPRILSAIQTRAGGNKG